MSGPKSLTDAGPCPLGGRRPLPEGGFAAGAEKVAGEAAAGRRGFTQAQIEAVWRAGGKLSLAQVLRCRVNYFTESLALGGAGFLASCSEALGYRRVAGKIAGVDFGGLMFLGKSRNPRDAIRAPG